jgi:predicted ABC-type ATPase
MSKRKKPPRPRCIVIAGPNGAGKTTFARTYLTKDAGIHHFINADLIAAGLSPLNPELAAIAAGRLVLKEIDRYVEAGLSFAFESTLSGRSHLAKFPRLKQRQYLIEIVYLRLASSDLACQRVAARVKQGGHSVPQEDIARRFGRSWDNFERLYKPMADAWAVYENSGASPKFLEKGP